MQFIQWARYTHVESDQAQGVACSYTIGTEEAVVRTYDGIANISNLDDPELEQFIIDRDDPSAW